MAGTIKSRRVSAFGFDPVRSDPGLGRFLEWSPEAAALVTVPDDRFVAVNAEFERLTGRAATDILGRSLEETGFESESGGALTVLPKAAGTRDRPIRLQRPDGTIRDVVISTGPIPVAGRRLGLLFLRDVTELGQEIRDGEGRYRSLFTGVPVGLYRTNPEGRFLEVNPALVEMFGFPSAESMCAVNVLSVYGKPEDRDRLRQIIESAGVVRNYELNMRRRDGSAMWVEIEARVVRDGAAKVVGYEGIVVDITERKLAEAVRRDLVAMVTHDIKNPLASIIAFVDYLRRNSGDLSDREAALDRIEASAREGLALAKNLLDADRIERSGLPLQRQLTSVNRLVEEGLRNQSGLARVYGVEIETRLDPRLPLLEIDPQLLDRVVANLVGNALKFAPEGTRITVETTQDEGRVTLSVRDRGPGVPADKRKDLFERFQSLEGSRRDSTGLGLFIVRMILEAHGGEVGVECPEEGGALFRISLPIGDAAARRF